MTVTPVPVATGRWRNEKCLNTFTQIVEVFVLLYESLVGQ